MTKNAKNDGARRRASSQVASLKKALRAKTREVELLQGMIRITRSHLDLSIILKEIMERVVEVTRADACFIYLFDLSRQELVLQASKNPHPKLIGRIRLEVGEGITGWVAKEQKCVVLSHNAYHDPRFKMFHRLPEDRYHAFLSMPVIGRGEKGGEVVGVINVQHQRPHTYSENEIALLTTMGQQVGGVIENARLYEEMKKKAMQVETLSRVSQTITSNRYIEEILQIIVTMTAEMMQSKICSMMLLDEATKTLRIVATQSLSVAYRNKPDIQVGESVSGRAVQEQRPIAVLDVTKDPAYSFPEIARAEGLCSLLSVPMKVKDRVRGVINIYTSSEHLFSQEEIRLLSAVANQAAVAIEHTVLCGTTLFAREEIGISR